MRSKSCDVGGAAPLSRRGPSFTTRGSGSLSSPFSETTSRKFLSPESCSERRSCFGATRGRRSRRHVGRLLRRQRLVEHRIDVALAAQHAVRRGRGAADGGRARRAQRARRRRLSAVRRLAARLRLRVAAAPLHGVATARRHPARPTPAADPSAETRVRERASAPRHWPDRPTSCAPPRPRPCGSIPRARGARASRRSRSAAG